MHFLIVGGSRGLGATVVASVPRDDDRVTIISRTPADAQRQHGSHHRWIQSDLSSQSAPEDVARALHGDPIDVLMYVAGIWERTAFEETTAEELRQIVTVNLTSFVVLVHALLPNLKAARNSRIIGIGSTSGLPNAGSASVAYAASKWGLRGACSALREALRKYRTSVTCVSVGSMGDAADAIPREEIAATLRWLVHETSSACPKEIWMPAVSDTDV